MENVFVVVGLGNPGKQFEKTRHNLGFQVLECLSERHDIPIIKLKHKGLIGEGKIKLAKVVFLKPQTYMNLSGESVREIVDWYKINISNLILVYDDIDVNPGEIKIRAKGSAGTHNGMRSVINQLCSDAFPRVRVGIGKPVGPIDLADYVLSKFKTSEHSLVKDVVGNAADAIECIIAEGIDASMNKYNKKATQSE